IMRTVPVTPGAVLFVCQKLCCENGISERPQAFRYPEIQNHFPLKMPRAQAEGILNRPALCAMHGIFWFLC
ncbi:MAG: hypothetical protein UDS56_00430, partial [Faecalibacterium prausnitzii]|nr:hypothetical protein [Faecalibacterium prausnitzii]